MKHVLSRWLLITCLSGLLTVTLAATSILQAAEMKLGYVDPERIFSESKAGKAGMSKLAEFEKERTADLDKKRDEIKVMEDTARQQSFTLSEAARIEKEEEIKRAKIDLKRLAEDADRELNRLQKEFLEKIDKEVMKIIERIGKEQGFTAIFSTAGGALLYADTSLDITAEVIKAYDAEHP